MSSTVYGVEKLFSQQEHEPNGKIYMVVEKIVIDDTWDEWYRHGVYKTREEAENAVQELEQISVSDERVKTVYKVVEI